MWYETILWSISVIYAVFTLRLWITWRRIKPFRCDDSDLLSGDDLLITVIIPVRNEATNILLLLEDLSRQSLPLNRFEVWVVDDASTDETRELVREFAGRSDLKLNLLELNDERTASPKKRAIDAAVQRAHGTLMVTTDGDCRVGEGWLRSIALCHQYTGAKCISGPVTFTKEKVMTDHLQTVEFSALVGSGACAIEAANPNMCNGANFAYEKSAFFEVGGFEGVDHIASGDDEFLLHKFAARFPGKVVFLKSEDAIVQTAPHHSWAGFKRQRQRWASKWKHYKSASPKLMAVFILIVNLFAILTVLLYGVGVLDGHTALSVLLLKVLPEWLFIGAVLRFLKKERSIGYIPLVQVAYPFYVVFFGLVGQKGAYSWKGRELT